jgi:hypothetical protein
VPVQGGKGGTHGAAADKCSMAGAETGCGAMVGTVGMAWWLRRLAHGEKIAGGLRPDQISVGLAL